jgi:phosphoglycolate phosphatase-like HAD superfamily hydrolase
MADPRSAGAGNEPAVASVEPPVAPRHVERGVVVFDLDGTLLDDMPLISRVAGDVLYRAFGTPPEAGRRHYLATTGLPFEAQLAQLYPDSPPQLREQTARIFHARKVQEAYAHARLFPEVPKMVKRLDQEHWTLVVSTGAEREVAELLLEREGIRIWFEAVLGSGQGTKREHLEEYRRRYPAVPIFLVGDSRFDLEAATDLEVPMLARSASYPGWTLTPEVFREWGAKWADPSLASLPDALADLERGPRTTRPRQPPARRSRPARRGSPPPRRRAARPGRAR